MDNRMKAIIFDMDGVIFDSENLIKNCWLKIAEQYQIPHMAESCDACLGLDKAQTREKMLEIYGADFPFRQYSDEMMQLFLKEADKGLTMKIGVIEILSYLKEQKIKVGLATSTIERVAKKELRDAGLLSYFDKIVCGDMIKKGKPAPDIYLKACEELEVIPEKAYAVEDSFNGVKAAHSAGLKVLMVPDLAQPDEEIRQLTWRIFSSLLEVKAYLV